MRLFIRYILGIVFILAGNACKEISETGKDAKASTNLEPDTSLALKAKAKEEHIVFDRQANDWARYFGGLPPLPESQLDSLDYRPEAKTHQAFFAKAWEWKEKKLLNPLSQWAKSELAQERQKAQTVFYPFSGPDFMTIHTLYPNAERYILIGLESEGQIPPLEQIKKQLLPATLDNLRVALNDILNYSFFKTNDMRAELNRYQIRGTLPILLAFIARRGNTVLSLEHIQINKEGKVEPSSPETTQLPEDSVVTGIQIKFRATDSSAVQTLQYFSANINDTYIKKLRGVIAFLKSLKPAYAYLKSASYLMHTEHFSTIRNIILGVSQSLLQDDSGIALRYFDKSQWELIFYGAYTSPIPLFASRYQAELRKIYDRKEGVRPLPFGIGYQFREGTSNLMLARKKNS
jgi:hypothetical protein